MKVKALHLFTDLEAGIDRNPGDVFTVTAQRAKALMESDYGCLVEEVKEAKKPKKKAEEQ